MAIQIQLLQAGDLHVLSRVADDVFDEAIDPKLTEEFLKDPRHHIAVGIEDGVVVGFASAVHYHHPDKPPELWINEVATSSAHQRRGVALAVLNTLFDLGRRLGCKESWVLTDDDNTAARALYRAAGGTETTGVVMVSFPLNS